jgi:hypothetical protein
MVRVREKCDDDPQKDPNPNPVMSRVASPRTPRIFTKNKEEEESRKTARLVEIVGTALSR